MRHVQVFDETAWQYSKGQIDMVATADKARQLPAYGALRDYLSGEPHWAG